VDIVAWPISGMHVRRSAAYVFTSRPCNAFNAEAFRLEAELSEKKYFEALIQASASSNVTSKRLCSRL